MEQTPQRSSSPTQSQVDAVTEEQISTEDAKKEEAIADGGLGEEGEDTEEEDYQDYSDEEGVEHVSVIDCWDSLTP